jgi:hypothetical protein
MFKVFDGLEQSKYTKGKMLESKMRQALLKKGEVVQNQEKHIKYIEKNMNLIYTYNC